MLNLSSILLLLGVAVNNLCGLNNSLGVNNSVGANKNFSARNINNDCKQIRGVSL